MPGSRKRSFPDQDKICKSLSVCLIDYDRPGYGLSDDLSEDEQSNYRFIDSVRDVTAILQDLERNENPLLAVGHSFGSMYAQAFAAARPDVTAHLLLLGGFVDIERIGGTWTNTALSNAHAYSTESEEDVIADVTMRAEQIQLDPEWLFKFHESELTQDDREVLQLDTSFEALVETALRRLIVASYSEAVRQGAAGMRNDRLALLRDRGFALQDIYDVPTHFWQGGRDVFTDTRNSWKFARQLHKAYMAPISLEISPDAGHYRALLMLPKLLERCMENIDDPTPFDGNGVGIGMREWVARNFELVPVGEKASA